MQDIARYETVMLSAIQQPSSCLHFLRPGRVVRVREGHLDWGWGIVVSVMRKAVAVNAAVQAEDMGPASAYVLDLLLSCDAASVKGKSHCPSNGLNVCDTEEVTCQAMAANAAGGKGPASVYVLDLLPSCDAASIKGISKRPYFQQCSERL